MAVFRGSFSADAAAAVVQLDAFPGAPDFAEVLRSLRNKSLIYSSGAVGDVARYRMYDVVSAYAKKRLAQSGLRATTEQLAIDWFVQLGEGLAEAARLGDTDAHEAIAQDLDNFSAVVENTTEQRPLIAVTTLLAIEPLLAVRGPYDLWTQHMATAHQLAATLPLHVQVRAADAYASSMLARGRPDESLALVKPLLDACEEAEESATVLRIRVVQIQLALGDLKAANAAAAFVIAEAKGGPHYGEAMAVAGDVRYALGDLVMARKLLNQGAIRQRCPRKRASVLAELGDICRIEGDVRRAKENYDEAHVMFRRLHDKPGVARILAKIGSMSLDLEDYDGTVRHEMGDPKAAQGYEAAIASLKETGDRRFVAIFLARLGSLEADQDKPIEAAAHLDQAVALVKRSSDPMGTSAVALHYAHLGVARNGASGAQAAKRAYWVGVGTAQTPGAAANSHDVRLAARMLAARIKQLKGAS